MTTEPESTAPDSAAAAAEDAPIVHQIDPRRLAGLAAIAGIGVVVIGAIGGIIWGAVVPGLIGVVVSGDRAGLLPADFGHRFDAVALFACISFVAGVLGGVGAWWVRPLRGSFGAVAATMGAIVGAAAGAWIGGLIAGARHAGPGNTAPGQFFQSAPSLRLRGAVIDGLGLNLSWAIVIVAPTGALLAYLVLLLSARRADLGVMPTGRASGGGQTSASTYSADES